VALIYRARCFSPEGSLLAKLSSLAGRVASAFWGMIPKSGGRFPEKIMPKPEISDESDSAKLDRILARILAKCSAARIAARRFA
jgi:hypothetical protein